MQIYELVETNRCGQFWYLGDLPNGKVQGLWLCSGQLGDVRKDSLKRGLVDDPYYPRVFGVGFRGKGNYSRTKHPKTYSCWMNMMKRCYNDKDKDYKRYGGMGVKVCKHWHNFQNFAHWYRLNHVSGWKLDKDLLSKSVGYYGPDTCLFIPHRLNLYLSIEDKGVHFCKTSGKYIAKMKTLSGKQKVLGKFEKETDARSASELARKENTKSLTSEMLESGEITQEIWEAVNDRV